MTIEQRMQYAIKWIAREKGTTQAGIALELGYTNTTVLSQILNGKKPIPNNLAERIALLHERINLEFLKGLSDEMLIDGDRPPIVVPPLHQPKKNATSTQPQMPQPSSDYASIVANLTDTVKSQQALIAKLTDIITNKNNIV